MVERSIEITNKYGLHARASTRLAQLAQSYHSNILISRVTGDQEVDAKSVLGILSLGAEHGEVVRIRISGTDAQDAMEAVTRLFRNRFDED